jgi:hypothetical protein
MYNVHVKKSIKAQFWIGAARSKAQPRGKLRELRGLR